MGFFSDESKRKYTYFLYTPRLVLPPHTQANNRPSFS